MLTKCSCSLISLNSEQESLIRFGSEDEVRCYKNMLFCVCPSAVNAVNASGEFSVFSELKLIDLPHIIILRLCHNVLIYICPFDYLIYSAS